MNGPQGKSLELQKANGRQKKTIVPTIISTAELPKIEIPLSRWRVDLRSAGALSDSVERFLEVLEGAAPGAELYHQAARAIFYLRNDHPAPSDLWAAYFRLLNALVGGSLFAAPHVEKLATDHWRYATQQQRFAFSNPSLNCPAIDDACSDNSVKYSSLTRRPGNA